MSRASQMERKQHEKQTPDEEAEANCHQCAGGARQKQAKASYGVEAAHDRNPSALMCRTGSGDDFQHAAEEQPDSDHPDERDGHPAWLDKPERTKTRKELAEKNTEARRGG